MKKIIVASALILLSFRTETPKSLKIELTTEEWQQVIVSVQTSDQLSAKSASTIIAKIQTAYSVAMDTTKKDSTKIKK